MFKSHVSLIGLMMVVACAGSDGADGADGTNGTNGINGTDGVDGTDGKSALVVVTEDTEECLSGGQRIDAGIDDNGNGTLEPDEIDSTSYICNGDSVTSLVDVTPLPQGTNCVAGGQRIDVGIDDNRNGTLDADEIDDTSYVCNSAVRARYVFLASWLGNGGFDVFDVHANVWRPAAPLPAASRGQIASDGDQIVLIGTDNVVYRYDVTTNTWADDGAGPGPGSLSFVRAVDGKHYVCDEGTTTLHVRDAGAWTALPLPAACSLAGGVDVVAHEVYVKEYGNSNFMVIDSRTDTVARRITDGVPIGESTSSAAVLDGYFYARSDVGNILRVDGVTGGLVDTGDDPTGLYVALVADPAAHVIYVKSADGFRAYHPSFGAFDVLPPGPNQATFATLTVLY